MRKVLPFRIPKTESESFRVQVDEHDYFYDTLHNHKEIQITLVVQGEGTLICGDYVGNFQSGDLFIVGANQPHVMRSNADYYEAGSVKKSHSISLFFDKHSFGSEFFSLPELELLSAFLNRTQKGLRFGERTRDKIKPRMFALEHQPALDRFIEMLKIMQLLAESEDYEYLAHASEVKEYDEADGSRMNQIFQFTMQEYHRNIPLKEVADLANLTPNAFCRFFKKRTRKTYIAFLIEIRISNACKMLKNKDLSIAQVCYQCGFNNLSHFNRNFKRVIGCTPSEFVKRSKEVN